MNFTVPNVGKVPIMTTGRYFRAALSLTTLGILAGCAGQGGFLSPRASTGSLTTSISHLEFENEQLRRQVNGLKTENREVENRLVQEESVNGDLSARLDDARNALRGRGEFADPIERAAVPEPPKTLPAGSSNRKPRKPPFAKIPIQNDRDPPANPKSGAAQDPFDELKIPRDDLPDPQAALDLNSRWLPVARGSSSSSRVKR